MNKSLIIFAVAALTILVACSKRDTSRSVQNQINATSESDTNNVDACALVTSKEIESIQGEAVKGMIPSANSDGGFTISECYFTLPTSSKSIVVSITRRGRKVNARNPKDFWSERFHRERSEAEKEQGKKEEEEQERQPTATKVENLGDDAFWTITAMGGGTLYVLKGNSYLRIGVGGTGDAATKLSKAKALAEIALKRL